MLEHQPWLLGEQPSIADFAVYHSLWFTRHQVPVLAGLLESTPAVGAWMDRLAAIGHGSFTRMTAQEAITVAQAATPAELPSEPHQDYHGIALGSAVTISAESFGQEPTSGVLIAATRTRYTLRREDERAGVVHVHFPRVGFLLKKDESA